MKVNTLFNRAIRIPASTDYLRKELIEHANARVGDMLRVDRLIEELATGHVVQSIWRTS